MRYLESQFGYNRGRDWPARSPDLNPCDFFTWGFLKSKVKVPVTNLNFTLNRIKAYSLRHATRDEVNHIIRREV